MMLIDILNTRMQLATERDVAADPLLSRAIKRLAYEGEYLLGIGHHPWVRSCANSLNDGNNWDGYAMAVHLAYHLENRGYECTGEVKLIPNDGSDVDLVVTCPNGIKIAIECVATQEPQTFWTTPVPDPEVPGLYLSEIAPDHDNEGLFRRMQHKIRIKTIRAARDAQRQTQYQGPTKFPEPSDAMIHMLTVDVTRGAGTPLDWCDLQALSLGKGATGGIVQDNVLGLFESSNLLGPSFGIEFTGNQYLRNRIHAIFYFSDTSHWRCSLDPTYHGCFVVNPSLALTEPQIAAVNDLGRALSDLVAEWLTGVNVTIQIPQRPAEVGPKLEQFHFGGETSIQRPVGKIITSLVREKAYENWIRRGKPEGDDWTDWFAAKRELEKL